MKIIETKIQKRFADIDVFRHVNNVHQQEYLDLGKTDYCRRVLGLDGLVDSPTLMIVSTRTDFVEQVRYEDEIAVRTRVGRVGTKSVTIRQQIVAIGADGSGTVGEAEITAGITAAASQSTETASLTETVCTESESVLVCFDLGAQRTVEIPDEWRERIGDE